MTVVNYVVDMCILSFVEPKSIQKINNSLKYTFYTVLVLTLHCEFLFFYVCNFYGPYIELLEKVLGVYDCNCIY